MHQYGPQFEWACWTPTRGAEALVAGSLLAIIARRRKISTTVTRVLAGVGFALLLCVAVLDRHAFLNTDSGPYMYTIGYTGINCLSVALIAAAIQRIPVLVDVLRSSSLRWFGRHSYGLYVYHVPLFFLGNHLVSILSKGRNPHALPFPWSVVTWATLIGSSIVVAWISFRFIESPILALKDHFAPVYMPEEEVPSLKAMAATAKA